MHGRQYYIIFAACGNFFLNGLLLGWNDPGIIKLLDEDQSPLGHVATPGEISLISGITYSGIIFIPIATGLANLIGRKLNMILASVIICVSWLFIGAATHVYVLCLGKFLGSCGVTLMYPATVLYLSEIASDDIRGLALTIMGLSINCGILTEYILGPYVSYKVLGYIGVVFSVAFFVMSLFIPESPRFFLMKGNAEKAHEIYKMLGKSLEQEMRENKLMLSNKKDEQHTLMSKLKMLFCVRRNLKAFTIICVIFIFQVLSGFSAFVMYMTSIFEAAGSSIPAHIATIIVGVSQLIPCMVSSVLVDRIGRKTLLLSSCLVTALTNFALGLVFYLESVKNPVSQHLTWLPIVCLIIFMLFYWIGLGVIPLGLSAELLDVTVKDVGSTIGITLEIVIAVVLTTCFGSISSVLGSHGTFWTFSACCLLNFVFIYFTLPETKLKSYSEIQESLKI